MKTNDVIRVLAWVVVVGLVVVMCSKSRAGYSASVSGTGGTVSVSVNPATMQLNWSAGRTGYTAGQGEGIVRLHRVNTSGQDDYQQILVDWGHNAPTSGSGTVATQSGYIYYLNADYVGTDGVTVTNRVQKWLTVSAPKKVTLSLHNTSDVPVKYRVMDNSGVVLGEVTLQPHTALIQTTEVPDNVSLPLRVVYQISGYVLDNNDNWVVDPTATATETATSGGQTIDASGTQPFIVDSTDNTTPPLNVDPPGVAPSGTGQESSRGGSIWKPVDQYTPTGNATVGNATVPVYGLTIPAYREGVDKITGAVNGVKSSVDALKADIDSAADVAATTFDQTADADPATGYGTALDKTAASGVVSKLPSAPAITNVSTSQTAFSFTFVPPGLSSPVTCEIDLTKYNTPISVFRALMLAGLAIAFYFVTVKTIRGAFA